MHNYPPTNDIVFKKLFGEDNKRTKESLVFLINEIVGFKKNDKIKEVTILNPYTVSDIKDKRAILDIKAKSENGIKYNVEIQVNKQENYSLRALYYWAKLYAEDLPSGNDYSKLSKTIGIHILDFDYYEGMHIHKKHTMSYDIKEQKKRKESFRQIEMHSIELTKLDKNFIDYNNTIKVIAAFLKDPEFIVKNRDRFTKEKYLYLEKLSENYKEMHFSKKEKDGLEDRLKHERDEISIRNTMVNEAKREGIKEGIKEGKIEIAEKMLSLDLDIKLIIKATGLSAEEIMKLK